MASVSAEKQRVEERLRQSSDSSQKTIKSLENRLTSLQGDLDLAKSELATAQAEYEGYKVNKSSRIGKHGCG